MKLNVKSEIGLGILCLFPFIMEASPSIGFLPSGSRASLDLRERVSQNYHLQGFEFASDPSDTIPSDVIRARLDWVGRKAPDFSLFDLDGREADLSASKGKVVVLDFWATWCTPCREEMPILEKIAGDYKPGVVVWGISDEEPAKVKTWIAKNQRKLRTLLDPTGKTSDQYQVMSIPVLIVIGRDGKVLGYYMGVQSEQSLRSAIDAGLRKTKND